MMCIGCEEHEHDCCDNILLPGSCGCGCARILDPPPLRTNLIVIMGTVPHDPRACWRQVEREKRHQRERRQREVA
jgi:hypothetical protein